MDDREAAVEIGARALGDRYQISGQRGDIKTARPSGDVLRDCTRAVLESVGFHEMREALAALDQELLFDKPVSGTAASAFALARAALSKSSGQSLERGENPNATE